MLARRSYLGWAGFCLLVLLANLPWFFLWRLAVQRNDSDYGDEFVLFLLAVIITTGLAAVVALVVRGIISRKWGMLAFLFAINIYWVAKWIEFARASTENDIGYQWARAVLLVLIVITSVAGAMFYWLIGKLVQFVRQKRVTH